MMSTDTTNQPHQGRNVKRFREMLGIKQEALAFDLGDSWTQKKVSLLEAKETIEPDILEQVARILKVPVDAIRNFSEEAANNFINNFYDESTNQGNNYYCTFNPIEKIIQLYDEKITLYEEKIALYERMLKEKSDLLEKLAVDKHP